MTKQHLFRNATFGASWFVAAITLAACDLPLPGEDGGVDSNGDGPVDDGGEDSNGDGMDPGDGGQDSNGDGMDPVDEGGDEGGDDCGCDEPDPPPCDEPVDPCLAAFEECLQWSDDPAACEQILQECFPEPEPDPCWEQYESCTNDFGPMAPECEALLQQCWGEPEPEPQPCEAEYYGCLEMGAPPSECEGILEQCDPEPQPDPCGEAFQGCIEQGVDPAECEAELLVCWCGPADPMCTGEPGDPGDDAGMGEQ